MPPILDVILWGVRGSYFCLFGGGESVRPASYFTALETEVQTQDGSQTLRGTQHILQVSFDILLISFGALGHGLVCA